MTEKKIPQPMFDKLLDAVTVAGQSDDVTGPHEQENVKKALMVLWRCLNPISRQRFIAMLDADLLPIPIKKRDDRIKQEAKVVEMIQHWPAVMANVPDAQRGFAMSIMKNRSNKAWYPSDKQIAVMSAIFAERYIEDVGGSLVDGGDE